MSQPFTHARIGYDSVTKRGTVAASSEITGYPATAAANSLTYSFWSAGLPSTWEVKVPSAEECNYFGVAAHTLHSSHVVAAMQAFVGASWETLPALVPFGDVWRFSGDLFGERGAAPGTTVASLRRGLAVDGLPIVDGYRQRVSKFGTHSLTVEPASTNILEENVRNCGDTNGDLTGFDVASTASYSTDHAVSGNGCALINNSGSAGSLKVSGISISTSTKYSFSCKTLPLEKNISAISVKAYGDVSGLLNQVPSYNQGQHQWEERWVTFTTGGSDSTVALEVTTTSGSVWSDEWQLEQNDFPMTWVDGSRAAGTLQYQPEIMQQINSDLTVNLWFRSNPSPYTTLKIFEAQQGSSANLVSLSATNVAGNPTLVLKTSASDASIDTLTVSGSLWTGGFEAYGWHLITLVIRPSVSGTDNKLVYFDGRLVGSTETTKLPDWKYVQSLTIGYDASTPIGLEGRAFVGEALVLNRAASAAEIKKWYDEDTAADETALDLPSHDDDRPIMRLVEAATTNRFRLKFAGQSTPVIGVIYIGKALEMERPLYGGHTPMNFARSTVIRPNTSSGGQFLGRSIVRAGSRGSWSWQNLTAAWVRQYLDAFLVSIRKTPFFILWRPSKYPGEAGYCWTTGDQIPSNSGVAGLMQFSLEAEGLGVE